MSSVPYPITASNIDDLKKQTMDLLRYIYEEKLGGSTLGDVFEQPEDTLQLRISDGFTKKGNKLAVDVNHKTIQSIGNQLQTIGESNDFYPITSLQVGGLGGLEKQTRTLTMTNGLITTVSAESGWS